MKRTAFIKMLSLALCLLMLVAVFAACDDKGKGGITTTTTTTTPKADDGTGKLGIIPDSVDYGGNTYKLLLWDSAKTTIFPEAQVDGTDIKNDLFERNEMIETELNLQYDVTYMASSSSATALFDEAKTGKNAYEAICCYSTYPPQLAQLGLLKDLSSMEYPATEMEWYPKQIQNWEIKGRLFFVANNSSIRNIVANWVIYANNTMIEEKNLDEIADVVLAGDWTLDVLKTYSRHWAVEAEGNANKAEEDRVYGFALIHCTAIEAFYHAAGFQAARINSEGVPEFAFLDGADIERVSAFVDTFLDICNSPEFGYGNELYYGNWEAPLENENAAFYAGALDQYKKIDGESGKFTIIPLPKLNDGQEDYHSITNWAFDVWCVPTTATDPEVGALTIEAMSYDDYNSIAYKFWDKDFKYRYSSDDRGVQIFDIIRKSFYADFSRAWQVGTPYGPLKNCLSKGTIVMENNYVEEMGEGLGDQYGMNLHNLIKKIDKLPK